MLPAYIWELFMVFLFFNPDSFYIYPSVRHLFVIGVQEDQGLASGISQRRKQDCGAFSRINILKDAIFRWHLLIVYQ